MTNTTRADSLIEAIGALAPFDEHNRALAESVHPPQWVNPEPPSEPYQLVVIGAGTAGLVTAAGAAGLGARVALVERELLGGDCLNVGCVPSKALIRCARAAADARQAAAYGVRVEGVSVDFGAVMERMRRLRAKIAPNDSASRFKGLGVDVYIGSAGFTADGNVRVGDTLLRTKRAVIATGARATGLGIPGLDEAGFLTNETLFSLTELPRRLCVIGAGPIGCEMAQSFARFGSRVTLLEAAPRILGREVPDAAHVVERALVADGIEILRDAKTLGVERRGEERVLRVEVEGATREIVCDHILLGVGRAPNVDGLNLEAVGVEYDARKGVRVDEFMQTTNPAIFAAGDICSPYKFTHTADAQARIVIQNALFSLGPFGRARSSSLTIPWCTYTDPEIAHVGVYGHEAAEKGIEIDTIRIDLDDVDRAILDGDEGGLLEVHVEQGSDRILGATLVARHAGEMISEITLAMVAGAGMKTLAKTIHPYPTQAEAFKRAGDAFNRGRLTPAAKKFLDFVLRLKA